MKAGFRALAACLLLAIVHTWPIAAAPGTNSLNWHSDADLNTWQMSWIDHTLPRHPTRLFDGNIFAPEPDTLTYTDPLIVPALVAAPVYWLSGSPVLTFNVSLIAGLTLTAWAGWFVVWRWTGSWGAGLVSGALIAFNVHLLTRLAHVQAAHSWGIPLAMYFADRLIERPTRRDGIWLALTITATAATSLYTLAFVCLSVAVIGITGVVGLPRWRGFAAIVVASLAGFVLAAPVLWPYARLAASGATRPLSVVAQFSATPFGYLASTTHADGGWTHRFYQGDVNVLFAGVAAMGLALVGAAMTMGVGVTRRRRLALAMIAVAGIVLSFGPATALYRLSYAAVPPLRGLRAAARFGYLYLVVTAMFAGFGVAALQRVARTGARAAAIVLFALLAVSLEAWCGPVYTVPFHGVPPIYEELTRVTTPVLLAEVPFYPPEAVYENGEYVVNATLHWQPLANGTSGAIPQSYRRRAAAFWAFPRDWAIDAMEREGVTHVMVHLERLSPRDVADIQESLGHRSDLQLIASDAHGHRLYRVTKNQQAGGK